jgi:hypothetical protein
MKHIGILSLVLALVASNAVAQERYNYRDYNRPTMERRDNRDLALSLATIAIAAALVKRDNPQPQMVYRYEQPLYYNYNSEYNAYQRGFEDRVRENRELRNQRAYNCGYYQYC